MEIHSVVRAVITSVTGAEGFEDDDDFSHDIGLGWNLIYQLEIRAMLPENLPKTRHLVSSSLTV